jgi:hypothetical protein
MTRTPVEIPDSLFQRLRERFGEAGMVELTATIAWENFRARFDHAFGIEAEGFSDGAYCALPVSSNAKALTTEGTEEHGGKGISTSPVIKFLTT